MFKKFIENLKAKVTAYKQAELHAKWNAVRDALTDKYKREEAKSKGVNLPVFILVNQQMDKIKTRKALVKYVCGLEVKGTSPISIIKYIFIIVYFK